MNILSMQTDVAYVMRQLTLAKEYSESGFRHHSVYDCITRAMDGMERIEAEIKDIRDVINPRQFGDDPGGLSGTELAMPDYQIVCPICPWWNLRNEVGGNTMADFADHVYTYHWRKIDNSKTCPCCVFRLAWTGRADYLSHVHTNFDAIMTILHAQSLGVKP